MTLTSEEFVEAFHALAGTTFAEKKRNLFVLLNDNQNASLDISNLTPQTSWQGNLKFEILKFYKNGAQLVEMLQEENPAFTRKLLKLDWFVKDTVGSIEPERLVKGIFSKLSYNSKLKLLNKLGLIMDDSSKCDDFFVTVKESYGTYLATKLLPSCSQALMLKVLEDNRVELTPTQLLRLIKRNPAIAEEIFEKIHNYDQDINIGDKYQHVFEHVLHEDLQTFLRLNKKYPNYIKLGKRASRKFVTKNKDACLNHPKVFQKLLKETQIAKGLGEDFHAFFSEIFPKSFNSLHISDLSCLLAGVKDQEKLDLVLSTFEKHYGEKLLEHHRFLVPEVFGWMSSEFKGRWLETHSKPKDMPIEMWISFMDADKSVPLLIDKISLSSNVNERAQLVRSLVKTCKINKDESALAGVCEYMVNKHRNDQLSVRSDFLEEVKNNFNLRKLQERHWKYLNDLIRIMYENNEYFWWTHKYFEDYIHLCFTNGWPFDKNMELYVKQSIHTPIFLNNPKYGKRCWEACLNALPLCFSEDEFDSQCLTYLYHTCLWNMRQRKEKVSILKYRVMLDSILKKYTTERQYECQTILMYCIVSDYQESKDLRLLDILINKSNELNVREGFHWLFKNHPLDLLENLQPLLKYVSKQNLSNQKLREMFMPVVNEEVRKAVIAVCKEAVDNEDDRFKRSYLIILSFLLPTEDFTNYYERYCPQRDSCDASISKFQQHLPSCLKYFTPAHFTLPLLLKFCQGDYMKYVQNTLHLMCNNVAEEKLGCCIDELSNRAVSIRKHSIMLAVKLLSQESVHAVINKCMTAEKNASIRKTLFKSVFNLFLRNPNDCLWLLVRNTIEPIAVDDTEAFCKLAESKRVSKAFFVRYLMFTWETLSTLSYDTKLEQAKTKILNGVTSDKIVLLPSEFCTNLIEKNLFQTECYGLEMELNAFASKYLIYSDSMYTKQIVSIAKKYSRSSAGTIYNFVQQYCSYFLTQKCKDENVLAHFQKCWNSTFTPCQSLEDYLHIQFTSIVLDCFKTKSIEEPSGKIALLGNSLFELNSLDVATFKNVFVDSFAERFFEEVGGNTDENYVFLIDSIIIKGNSDASLSLALALMPLYAPVVSKIKNAYDSILEGAASNPHPLVQIQLHRYLINRIV